MGSSEATHGDRPAGAFLVRPACVVARRDSTMTHLASRAALRVVLALTLLVLLLTAAAARPDAAAAHAVKAKAPAKKRVSRGLRAVRIANRLTGIPYAWGGASPGSGFDCSGLVQYVYGKLGISLPHYTVSQYHRGRPVPRSRLRPGDLVFFYGLGHVGIYAGRGKYIHAPSSGSTVRWASLASASSYDGARRIVFN
jgi:cell wall-associated NlpC family hydrolase